LFNGAEEIQKQRNLNATVASEKNLPTRFNRCATLERFPTEWTHSVDKKSLNFRGLEHVLVEKVGQLFRNMLSSGACSLGGAARRYRQKSLRYTERHGLPAEVSSHAKTNATYRREGADQRGRCETPVTGNSSEELTTLLSTIGIGPPGA
jgi:hypothetical protein